MLKPTIRLGQVFQKTSMPVKQKISVPSRFFTSAKQTFNKSSIFDEKSNVKPRSIGQIKKENLLLKQELIAAREEVAKHFQDLSHKLAPKIKDTQTLTDSLHKIEELLKNASLQQLASNQLLIQQVENVAKHLEESGKEQVNNLKVIADIDSQELDKLQRLNANSESKLATGVAYSSIICGFLTVLNLLLICYQYYEQKNKEQEDKAIQAEKLKMKSQLVEQEIAKIQTSFYEYKLQEKQLEKQIEILGHQLESLKERPINFIFRDRYRIERIKTENLILCKKEELSRVQKLIEALAIYCKKRFDSEQKAIQQDMNISEGTETKETTKSCRL